VSHAVNSTLDLQTVLDTIVAKAVELSVTDAGAIYVFSDSRQKFRLRATHGMSQGLIDAIGKQQLGLNEVYIGTAARRREPVQIADLNDEPPSAVRDLILDAGYRALLVVPLLRPDAIAGALIVRRREPGLFTDSTVRLLQAFATQSVLAIQNARLFSQIEQKSEELAIASQHKSQFLANMSHELRTPLNSVLGFSEMLTDGIYGPLPERAQAALEKVRANGRHLLNLINDVLDLSKIEAGQLRLSLHEYSIRQALQSAMASVEAQARSKGIALASSCPDVLPTCFGDEQRITQILLNLLSNAVKFTDQGSVDVSLRVSGEALVISVRDTGPGIAEADQVRIFDEFQQVDSSSTRRKGGTGLGLAITKLFVEMHGGQIRVQSVLGEGSTFVVALPIRATAQNVGS
jgi:signal transduction histidine kinase